MVTPYPDIADYALLSDCHTAALVSRGGSVDWWCLPRFDSASTFGRLLDRERGGYCSIAPAVEHEVERRYLDGTLVLETRFATETGEATVTDCLLAPPLPERDHRRRLLRVVEGRRGSVDLAVEIVPRFDFGAVVPWMRRQRDRVLSATGGDDCLLAWSDADLEIDDRLDGMRASMTVQAGERRTLLLGFERPEALDEGWDLADPDGGLEQTIAWWREWCGGLRLPAGAPPELERSALVLRGLVYEPTGGMVAAPTTSLPESPGGERRWDYRFSWIRDSSLASRSLVQLGAEREADGFWRFVERSAADRAGELQVVYGAGGERRLDERELEGLEGYRGAGPVRIGNEAAYQLQLDAYGDVVVQSWRRHRRGRPPGDDGWRFVVGLVEFALEHWHLADAGIWERRTRPRHFVHSKMLAWTAVDHGLRLAEECGRPAPRERWRRAREEIRAAIESRGYDRRRGVFVQAFDRPELDAAVLRLPLHGFVAWDDERMLRTVDAIEEELGDERGLLRRYRDDDGLDGTEGAFLACSFWLVETLARQGRDARARAVYRRTVDTANDLGLLAEEYGGPRPQMLGNYPQALTHLAHVDAVLALADPRPAGMFEG